jgi:hypothetical protein
VLPREARPRILHQPQKQSDTDDAAYSVVSVPASVSLLTK